MSDDVEDPRDHGRRVREQRDAHLRDSAADMLNMLDGAGQAEHADTSRQLRAAHQGLFPHMSPQDRGQVVSEISPTVGTDWGGRPLERNGGRFSNNIGPVPGQVFRSRIDNSGELGESPLKRYMRGER